MQTAGTSLVAGSRSAMVVPQPSPPAQASCSAVRLSRQPAASPLSCGRQPAARSDRGSARRAIVTAAAKAVGGSSGKGFGPAPKATKPAVADDAQCPCGSGIVYGSCCAPYHRGTPVPSPEALLRSRFSAYALKAIDYIVDTTHPDSQEYTGSRAQYFTAVKQTMRRLDPISLKLRGSTEAGSTPDEAFISFQLERSIKDPSIPKNAPEVDKVLERSRFARHKGRWLYVDSQFLDE